MVSSKLLLFALPAFVLAANDWSKPCTSGSCCYEAGDGVNAPWSTLVLDGDTQAISDITEAAGWHILDCDSDATDGQDIRMVCTDQSAGCAHLFDGGAEHTIVRLPESCSSGPFARVVSTSISDNQDIPPAVAQKIKRDTPAQVRTLSFDFDFASIPASRGHVSLSVIATTNPNQLTTVQDMRRSLHTPRRFAQRDLQRKDFFSEFIKKGKAVTDAIFNAPSQSNSNDKGLGDIIEKGKDILDDIFHPSDSQSTDNKSSGLGDIIEKGKDIIDKGKDILDDIFNPQPSTPATTTDANAPASAPKPAVDIATPSTDPLSQVWNDLTQIGQNIANAFTGAAKKVKDFITQGVKPAADGPGLTKEIQLLDIHQQFPVLDTSINCPQQGDLPAYDAKVDISADVDATAKVVLGVAMTGSIIPPKIELLAVTAVFSGGAKSTFNIAANAEGQFDTGKLTLISQTLGGLDFPGIFSLGPRVSLGAQVAAHVGVIADMKLTAAFDLPNIGLVFPQSAGDSTTDASPADCPLTLSVGPTGANVTGVVEAHLIPRVDLGLNVLSGLAKAGIYLDLDAYGTLNFDVEAMPDTSKSTDVEALANPQVGGCAAMDAGIKITAGAEAAAGPIFPAQNFEFDLFKKNFDLFDKCFGTKSKRSVIPPTLNRRLDAGLLCPANIAQAIKVIEEVVTGKN